MYDIIVVGGGPAGMTAALYALRYGKSVLVIEKTGFGGQITHSPRVENFPGTLTMSGNEFAEKMLDQILQQGAAHIAQYGDQPAGAYGKERERQAVIAAVD